MAVSRINSHMSMLLNLFTSEWKVNGQKQVNSPKTVYKSDLHECPSCFICDDVNNLKNMHQDHLCNGKLENYSQMLLMCFNIKMVNLNKKGDKIEICQVCIDRLRDAFNFRRQVEASDVVERAKMKKDTAKDTDKQNSNMTKLECTTESKYINLNGKFGNKNSMDFNSFEVNDDSIDVNLEFDDMDFNPSNDNVLNKIAIDTMKTTLSPESEPINKVNTFDIPKLDPFALSCPICKENFTVHQALLRHYPIHFPNFLCDICGRSCLNKVSLIRHLGTHSDKRYPCKICKRTYANQGALAQHVRRFHKGMKGYCCTECPERFSDYSARNKHLTLEHGLPSRTYICPHCGKEFFRSSRLSEHIKRDHYKIRRYTCTECKYGFFSKGELKEHMLKHTGEKNFGCEKCGKSYARKKTLTEHLKIHANLRAHKCEFCGKSFIQKCTLKGHLKTHIKGIAKS